MFIGKRYEIHGEIGSEREYFGQMDLVLHEQFGGICKAGNGCIQTVYGRTQIGEIRGGPDKLVHSTKQKETESKLMVWGEGGAELFFVKKLLNGNRITADIMTWLKVVHKLIGIFDISVWKLRSFKNRLVFCLR